MIVPRTPADLFFPLCYLGYALETKQFTLGFDLTPFCCASQGASRTL